MAPATLFENVRVLDTRLGELSSAKNVLIRGNEIAQISSAPIKAESETEVIAGA
jgi:sensor domain CHASE-containing protein